ncbi:MAG: poly(ribitol-phosphate) beta-N-acetylglucosaminyltransferase, partial [Solirubrobacteraceae bacterium]|nr:poly(ribitol-phosphate) beta-N-acetylglucosaminyltransferase [Solirubrobacteraceae bacterium]
RSKALWRLTGAVFLRRDEAFNRAIYDEVLRLTRERFPPQLDRFLPFGLRMRSHILRNDDLEGIYAMARFEAGLRARIRVTRIEYVRAAAELAFEARLRGGLKVTADGRWDPPEELRPHVEGADLDAAKSISHAIVQPLLRAVADKTEQVLDPQMEAGVDKGLPVVRARATVPAGLAPGEWQLVVPVRIMGFHHTAMTVRQGDERPAPLTFRVRRGGRLDRPSWARRHLSGRAPRLTRALRRVAGGARSR